MPGKAAARACRISKALSRSITRSYFPASGDRPISAARVPAFLDALRLFTLAESLASAGSGALAGAAAVATP